MIEKENEVDFKDLFVPFTTLKAIHWIVFIGLIVFVNSLFNNFVLEDRAEIVRNISIQSMFNIPNLFVSKVGGQETITYYRPLLFTFYTVLYTLFKQNTFPYHLVQLSFWIGDTILVFLIFKKYFKIELAFFLSLLFLVHPMNEESVVWITNLQEVLFIFFGLLAIYILQRHKDKLKYFILANVALLLSIFSKETGILFFIIALLYVFLYNKKKLLLHTSLSLIAGLVYIILRFISHTPIQKEPLVPIMKLTLLSRMVNIPAIIFYYVTTFFYPKNLSVYHSWVVHNVQASTFIFPLLFDLVFFVILFLGCIYIFKKSKDKKAVWLFSAWFVVGLVFHLQLIPLDFTVSDHFFLFPFIGLIALLGLFLQSIQMTKYIKILLIFAVALILFIFGIRTMIRNTNWQNQSTILTHDIQVEKNDYLLELVYSTNLIESGQASVALPYVQKALLLYPEGWLAWNNLGAIYYTKGDIQNAKQAYLHSISIEKSFEAYENLGLLLKEQDDPNNALVFIRRATKIFPTSNKLWYYRFILAYKLKNYDEALLSAKYYFLLKRDNESYAIYTHLLQKRPITIE